MKRKPKPSLSTLFDRPKYRQRNIIERMFGWRKENRRIVTRLEKLAKSYAAMVYCFVPCGVCDISFRTEPNHGACMCKKIARRTCVAVLFYSD